MKPSTKKLIEKLAMFYIENTNQTEDEVIESVYKEASENHSTKFDASKEEVAEVVVNMDF